MIKEFSSKDFLNKFKRQLLNEKDNFNIDIKSKQSSLNSEENIDNNYNKE